MRNVLHDVQMTTVILFDKHHITVHYQTTQIQISIKHIEH